MGRRGPPGRPAGPEAVGHALPQADGGGGARGGELQGQEQILGNVRDYDYDFKKIWYGPKADEVRRSISKGKCYCTYECFLTVNILFNPLMYPVILKEWAALKWAQLRHGPAYEMMPAAPQPVESYRVKL